MRHRAQALTLVLALLCLLAAGCGGGDDEEAAVEPPAADTSAAAGGDTGGAAGGGEGGVDLAADPSGALAYTTTTLEAPAGSVTIVLTNESSVPHNVVVEGMGLEESSETIMASTTELAVDLEAGEYTFYCSVGGHREAGMEGTLTVE